MCSWWTTISVFDAHTILIITSIINDKSEEVCETKYSKADDEANFLFKTKVGYQRPFEAILVPDKMINLEIILLFVYTL